MKEKKIDDRELENVSGGKDDGSASKGPAGSGGGHLDDLPGSPDGPGGDQFGQ